MDFNKPLQFVLSLDEGTTSCRAILYDKKGQIRCVSQKEFPQIFPSAGWVEHDANEIWSTQLEVAKDAVKKQGLTSANIAAIGITNQRETTVIWDRKTGVPIHNAIVWQDKRTAAYCNELKSNGLDKIITEKTGLIVDSYFSATKVKWILDNVPGAMARAQQGELAYGTIDCWLLWNLTAGAQHATDVSNASRSMLYNIHTMQWDQELLDIFQIPSSILPAVKSSSEVYGHCTLFDGPTDVPVSGIAGDQNAALFGQMCIEAGMVKTTYGTGAFLLMCTGDKPVPSKNNLLTTIAWQLNGVTTYALEGSVFIAGAVVQWLRDGLKIIKDSKDVEILAKEVSDSDGVYVVPAFSGLGAPHWNQHAKGTIVGLHRGSTGSHIARASIEGVAFQTMDVLHAMEMDVGMPIDAVKVDGGACKNNLLLEFQAELLNTRILRPAVVETTSLGAAYLAGLAVGYWKNIDEIKAIQEIERVFEPSKDQVKGAIDRKARVKGWRKAVDSTLSFAEDK